jgi:glucosamine kinase
MEKPITPPSYWLLAESGATKTHWVLVNQQTGEAVQSWTTDGVNIHVQQWAAVEQWIVADISPLFAPYTIDELIFYGASLAESSNQERMANLLSSGLHIPIVHVEHDLLAACRGTAQDQPGIVCVLGTGSNACQYDGHSIIDSRGGHGYLLGDEGSGADLGKRLLTVLLSDQLPNEIVDAFEASYGPLLSARNSIYQAEKPNVALAQFTHFLLQHRSHRAIKALMEAAFRDFMERTIIQFVDYMEDDIYFVGSVGNVFQQEISRTMDMYGIRAKRYIQSPIEGLLAYHNRIKKNDS